MSSDTTTTTPTSQQPAVEEDGIEGTPIKLDSNTPSLTTTTTEPIKGKYSSRNVTLVGWDDCPACVTAEDYINKELIPNSDVPTTLKKMLADTDDAKAIIAEKKLKVVPYLEECLIPLDPKDPPACRELKKFRKSDFKLKVNS